MDLCISASETASRIDGPKCTRRCRRTRGQIAAPQHSKSSMVKSSAVRDTPSLPSQLRSAPDGGGSLD